MLAELMRLQFSVAVGGTHGKTTTTSMVAALLDAGGLDPTVVNGGIINAYGTNAKVGEGDWIVVEADESDGTFLRLKSTCAIVTNIDPEHLDHYGDFDAVRKAFRDFVENIPFYGFAAVCTDHPEVQAMAAKVENRRLVPYGVNPQAEVRALNITMGPDGSRFDVIIAPLGGDVLTWRDMHLPMAGHHNVMNALAAISVARELGVSEGDIRKGLTGFGGVKRRFTTTGVANGVRVIDDYGHHPVEISSVLKAARAVTEGRVIAVVQPHRYSRLKDLFSEFCGCFNDADTVIVADVYSAGEAPCRAPAAMIWWKGSAGSDTAGPCPLAVRLSLRTWCQGKPALAIWWSCWAPGTSRPGPMPCRVSWKASRNDLAGQPTRSSRQAAAQ